MSLSDRERRLLAEIERNLRCRDPRFTRRIDALNRQGPQRFACHVSTRQVVCVLLVVVALTFLSAAILVLTAPQGRPPAHQTKALSPVTARPTMSVLISRVPS
ncbi:DUF3040 domain-containing protein [Actinomadura sp. ATCC 31491]|uniref:DUF3040 domain-containing protein n=1 Tax=Actinomadura luzonensis TaxID=2805427 RepID=A0ABT0FJU3_9ACTN|nr:DUF3040 domain-containing protein [Actinomadura luzonensis]MCK2212251.1 DUF3040 domain-containing protein [Actinomadura luzonensis]